MNKPTIDSLILKTLSHGNLEFISKQIDTQLKLLDTNKKVPNDGFTYGYVLHDWQKPEFGYKPRQLNPGYEQKKPMPSTRMMWGRYDGRIYDFVEFPEAWQFWLYELLGYAIGAEVPVGKIEYFYDVVNGKERIVHQHPYAHAKFTAGSRMFAYGNLIEDHRSFTDTKAPENGYADYVTKRNIGKPPYSWKCLTTTGNIVKILGQWNQYYIIEAFDLLKSPPKIEDVYDKLHLVHFATEQSVTELPMENGKRRWTVARYPQVKVVCRANGLPENGTPFPLCSKGGTNLMLKTDIQIMNPGDSFSYYEPKK